MKEKIKQLNDSAQVYFLIECAKLHTEHIKKLTEKVRAETKHFIGKKVSFFESNGFVMDVIIRYYSDKANVTVSLKCSNITKKGTVNKRDPFFTVDLFHSGLNILDQ